MKDDTQPIVIPLSPLRKAIASRMVEAKRNIPHFRLSQEIEVDALIRMRRELEAAHPGVSLSVNHLIVKACARALVDVPAMNVQWVDGALHQYGHADISVIVAVDGGVTCPVVRRANERSVLEIAAAMRDLAERAKRNELKMTEIAGGTFTISNLGMFGVESFDAIINPPQCAILAVGAFKSKVIVGDAPVTLRIAQVMRVTLALDHRALDGVVGASFLQALRGRIEEPGHMRAARA
jgi:pyruvate dehydrogenase E2 component (dihydrolipoamide acetyltransferase)